MVQEKGAAMWERLRKGSEVFLLGGLVLLGACQRSQPELLVVYSGDGQAYIEPCG